MVSWLFLSQMDGIWELIFCLQFLLFFFFFRGSIQTIDSFNFVKVAGVLL